MYTLIVFKVKGTTHVLHSLAALGAGVPGNQQRLQISLPHLVQVSVGHSGLDLIPCQCDGFVLELNQSEAKGNKTDKKKTEKKILLFQGTICLITTPAS